jgi:hypothetical protein
VDSRGRDYGQMIFHDKQVISMTEYDDKDCKLCYEQNFDTGAISYYHKLGEGEECDESKFRALMVNGNLVRYGRWSSVNSELKQKMIQNPGTYTEENSDKKYQTLLSDYDKFNVVFLGEKENF